MTNGHFNYTVISTTLTDAIANVALAEHEIVMLSQPQSNRRHEVGVVEHRHDFAAHIGDEPALGMRGEFAASEQPQRRRLMLKQGSPAPAIEGPDGGDPWRLTIELHTKMGEDVRRDALYRVERGAGHLEKTDLQRERHPVHRASTFPDLGKLLLAEAPRM